MSTCEISDLEDKHLKVLWRCKTEGKDLKIALDQEHLHYVHIAHVAALSFATYACVLAYRSHHTQADENLTEKENLCVSVVSKLLIACRKQVIEIPKKSAFEITEIISANTLGLAHFFILCLQQCFKPMLHLSYGHHLLFPVHLKRK